MTFIEGYDCSTVAEHDVDALRRFIKLFRHSAMAKMIAAYFIHVGIQIDDPDEKDEEERFNPLPDDCDPIDEALVRLDPTHVSLPWH